MLGARTYLLREGIHRFAAAWVRVRAAFGDGQSVSICETTLVVRGSGRAFLYLSIYLSGSDKIRLLGFTTLHDSRRYAIPRCWIPHTQTQRHGVLAMVNTPL